MNAEMLDLIESADLRCPVVVIRVVAVVVVGGGGVVLVLFGSMYLVGVSSSVSIASDHLIYLVAM